MKVGISTSTWFQVVPFCSLISEQFLFLLSDDFPHLNINVWPTKSGFSATSSCPLLNYWVSDDSDYTLGFEPPATGYRSLTGRQAPVTLHSVHYSTSVQT